MISIRLLRLDQLDAKLQLGDDPAELGDLGNRGADGFFNVFRDLVGTGL